jgi:hypothetical protein
VKQRKRTRFFLLFFFLFSFLRSAGGRGYKPLKAIHTEACKMSAIHGKPVKWTGQGTGFRSKMPRSGSLPGDQSCGDVIT